MKIPGINFVLLLKNAMRTVNHLFLPDSVMFMTHPKSSELKLRGHCSFLSHKEYLLPVLALHLKGTGRSMGL